MGILGIDNRTENMKTTETFAPFIGNHFACRLFAERLLDKPLDTQDPVKLELFWYGGRDYCSANGDPGNQKIVDAYNRDFSDLREKIIEFQTECPSNTFAQLKENNYNVHDDNVGALVNHFKGTEFDIVLETPKHLFIGEAKDESGLGADGTKVLVHQLIRQYVIAQILVRLARKEKCIVPFLVVDREKLKSIKNTAQVRFMIRRGWLSDRNVLSWGHGGDAA